MIDGAHNGENFIVKFYEENEADKIFKDFFSKSGWLNHPSGWNTYIETNKLYF